MIADLKKVFMLAGKPGLALLGYDLVQIIFARGKLDPGAVDGTAVIFACYSIFCLLFAWGEYKKNKILFEKMLYKSPLVFFILYTLWGGITCLWSPNLPLTAYRAIECFSIMFLMVAVTVKLTAYRNVDVLVKWSILYIFLTALAKILQGIGMIGFTGVFTPGSIFWYQAQFICPIFFYFGIMNAKNIIIKILLIAVSILAMSTVGYIAMGVGSIALFFGDKKSKKLGFAVLFIVVIYSALFGIKDLLSHTIFVEHDAFVEGDDSGRSVVWEFGWQAFHESPILGHGFFVAENYIARTDHMQSVVGMHNGFMSALVGEGIIGEVFFVLFFVCLFFVSISKKMPKKYRSALIASYIAVLIETYANPGLGFRIFNAWMPSMYASVLICTFGCFGEMLKYNAHPTIQKMLNKV